VQEALLDPDNDLRDTLVNRSFEDSETSDETDEVTESLPETLQHLCGLDHTASELLQMPSRALDKAEEMARQACDKAEEMARQAEEMARHARSRAEEMARHACDKAEEMARQACDRAEEMAWQAWEAGSSLVHHHHLPKWLKDNDFLIQGHRPQLHTFYACFKSIFRIHTETGNIWTHLLGFLAFIIIAIYFMLSPSTDVQFQEKAVFSAFFAGAILCLGFSWMFHTVYCHSEKVGRIFSKLDYCGISFLIMGSAVPWLYYSFYCRLSAKITYFVVIITLGIVCITVSMWDKFSQPNYRVVRAGAFVAFGLSGVIPAIHYTITDGYHEAVNFAALGTIIPMGVLYLSGALIYAARIPESIWPGKFDIWFQSHQIFHVFVVAAAFLHYHGMSQIANNRLTFGSCMGSS
jgi:adiponectin receptor